MSLELKKWNGGGRVLLVKTLINGVMYSVVHSCSVKPLLVDDYWKARILLITYKKTNSYTPKSAKLLLLIAFILSSMFLFQTDFNWNWNRADLSEKVQRTGWATEEGRCRNWCPVVSARGGFTTWRGGDEI